MASCAFGPCDRSTEHGGPGCYLCDVISALPQPGFTERSAPSPPPRAAAVKRIPKPKVQPTRKREPSLW